MRNFAHFACRHTSSSAVYIAVRDVHPRRTVGIYHLYICWFFRCGHLTSSLEPCSTSPSPFWVCRKEDILVYDTSKYDCCTSWSPPTDYRSKCIITSKVISSPNQPVSNGYHPSDSHGNKHKWASTPPRILTLQEARDPYCTPPRAAHAQGLLPLLAQGFVQ